MSPPSVLLLRLHGSLVGAAGHPRNCRPPWHLKYLERMLEDVGCAVSLRDAMVAPAPTAALVREAQAAEAAVHVVHATTLDLPELRTYAQAVRGAGAPVLLLVVGQVTAAPEALDGIAGVDAVVQGEPEEVVLAVVEALAAGASRAEALSAVPAQPALVKDPDSLPLARYTPEELRAYRMDYPLPINKKVRWGHVLSSRGCPHPCVYCSPVTRETWGRNFRPRSAASVVEEVDSLVALGANAICFDDDDLTATPGHTRRLSEALAARDTVVPWIAHARIDDVDGPLLETMARGGCVLLRFGVEAASERVLDTLQKRHRRGGWAERARDVFAHCRRLGIATTGLFLVGNPGETRAEAEQTLQLALDIKPDLVQFHYFTPYPGSAAFAEYRDQLDEGDIERLYHYETPRVNPSQIPDDELHGLQRDFYLRYFGRPRFLARHALRYGPFYLRNPGVALRIAPLGPLRRWIPT